MNRIRAIAFDLEGPIFDFEQLHFKSHIEAAKRVLGVNLTYEWIIEQVPNAIGGGDPNISFHIALHHRVHGAEHELLEQKKNAFEDNLHGKPIKVRSGVVEVIEWFKMNGFPVMIGSNTPRIAAERYLGSVEALRELRFVLAEDVANPKPWPDVYLETARQMKVHPREQLVFDDSHTGLEAACRAGSPRIATPLHRVTSVMERLEQHRPLRIIHSWDEIKIETIMEHVERELQD